LEPSPARTARFVAGGQTVPVRVLPGSPTKQKPHTTHSAEIYQMSDLKPGPSWQGAYHGSGYLSANTTGKTGAALAIQRASAFGTPAFPPAPPL